MRANGKYRKMIPTVPLSRWWLYTLQWDEPPSMGWSSKCAAKFFTLWAINGGLKSLSAKCSTHRLKKVMFVAAHFALRKHCEATQKVVNLSGLNNIYRPHRHPKKYITHNTFPNTVVGDTVGATFYAVWKKKGVNECQRLFLPLGLETRQGLNHVCDPKFWLAKPETTGSFRPQGANFLGFGWCNCDI